MENITISIEEYKELLIIKGKYEELKSQQTVNITYPPTLTREFYGSGQPIPKETYEITCNKKREE